MRSEREERTGGQVDRWTGGQVDGWTVGQGARELRDRTALELPITTNWPPAAYVSQSTQRFSADFVAPAARIV
jgi:hypothetical protein